MKKILFFLMLVFSFLKGTGYDFLNIPFSSKEAVLLEPYGVFANSASSIFVNPSSLHNLLGKNIETGYGKYIIDMHQGFFVFSNNSSLKTYVPEELQKESPEQEELEKIEENGIKWGAGIFYLNAGNFIGRDSLGNFTGDYKAQQMTLNITTPLPFFKEWNSAISFELLYQGISTYNSFAGAISLGFGKSFEKSIKDGKAGVYLFLKHLGYEFKSLEAEKSALPYSATLAGGIKWKTSFLGLSTGYILNENPFFSLSYYYNFNKYLGFAIGYTTKYNALKIESNLKSLFTGFSYGIELKIKKVSLFYGYSPFGVFGDLHRIDIGFGF